MAGPSVKSEHPVILCVLSLSDVVHVSCRNQTPIPPSVVHLDLKNTVRFERCVNLLGTQMSVNYVTCFFLYLPISSMMIKCLWSRCKSHFIYPASILVHPDFVLSIDLFIAYYFTLWFTKIRKILWIYSRYST